MDNETTGSNEAVPYYNIGNDSTLQYHKLNVADAVKAIHYHQGNLSAAAKHLQTSRSTLHRLVNSSNDITKLVDTLRTNKELGIHETAVDKIQELMKSDDENIVLKAVKIVLDRQQPAPTNKEEDNKEQETVEAVAQYLANLRQADEQNNTNDQTITE